jgi:hypothetical protein
MTTVKAMQYLISVLDLNPFVLVDSLKMALRCRNMYEFDACHKLHFMIFLYFIEQFFVNVLMVFKKVHGTSDVKDLLSS